jgi:hypothetical protein
MSSTTLIGRASMALAVLVASACAEKKADIQQESASAGPVVSPDSVARDSVARDTTRVTLVTVRRHHGADLADY